MADIPEELTEISQAITQAREFYPNHVMEACKHAIKIAFDISSAIGEISVSEANDCIIREFTEKLKNG